MRDDYFENLKFDDHRTYQVPLDAVEKATGIKFSWRNVNLPYKSADYTVLKASTLRKVHTFAEIFQSKLQLLGIKLQLSNSDLQKILNTKEKVQEKDIDVLKREGGAYTVKKFDIKSITF